MKKHICKFSNWDLGHCMKWVCFTKCILCLWTFVFGSKFYPLDRNLRVMSDVKISMSSHNIPSTNDNMKFLYAHMEYQCCMLNSICYLRLYIMIENNFWRWHSISFKQKNWFVAWPIIQSLVHFFHFLKHLSLMLFFARIDLFN